MVADADMVVFCKLESAVAVDALDTGAVMLLVTTEAVEAEVARGDVTLLAALLVGSATK